MAKRISNQTLLPGIEQALCKCGCGEYFMRAVTPRRREYINNTHKKRAQRRREKEARTESTVRLTPKGLLYYRCHDINELQPLWDSMTEAERDLIHLMCDTGRTPHEILIAAESLFAESEL